VLDVDIPSNAGVYRPIKVIAPEGTFVNAPFPAALGSRGQSGQRIRSVVLGALAQLMPDRLTGCPGGSEFAISASGYNEEQRRFVHLEFHNNTGQGGGPDRDGQDGGPYCIGNLANVPVELLEAEYPLRIDEYAFIPNSGGPGKYRGAMGVVRQYRMLVDDVLVQVRSDRFKHPPWGIFGGRPGWGARAFMNPGSDREEAMPSKFMRRLACGDVFRAEMAASGGYGDPMERDLDAVVEDVKQGKISIEHARKEYGVVLCSGGSEVDVQATQTARRET
jgi:N-methylhydantoinase B